MCEKMIQQSFFRCCRFLLQIFTDFSGVQSEFDRDLIKMRRIFRIPPLLRENGKMGKTSVF